MQTRQFERFLKRDGQRIATSEVFLGAALGKVTT
jgi:hypothetical protein